MTYLHNAGLFIYVYSIHRFSEGKKLHTNEFVKLINNCATCRPTDNYLF